MLPNPEVLEAQTRICTGPHQSRPLGLKDDDPDPDRILRLILQTAGGPTAPDPPVSRAQMGAFFTAMARRRDFPPQTRWSPAETAAWQRHLPALRQALPPQVAFLLDPAAEPLFDGPDRALVPGLRRILKGEHLSAADTADLLRAVLDEATDDALRAAVLIGQRMNIETLAEAEGYLDAVLAPDDLTPVATDSLTHLGLPFDGARRYFRPTLFVAAVRAAQERPTVLHGVDRMPPKNGVTEEALLAHLGARTDLTRPQAVALLEDPAIGLAYVSQRQYAPALYRLQTLRHHIAKRPVWSTTEKAQRLFVCPGYNALAVGFYHKGYDDKLLHLMQRRDDLDAGLAVKGEEGSVHFALRLGKPSTPQRRAVNYCRGFRRTSNGTVAVATDVNPQAYGLAYDHSPRPPEVSVATFARLGLDALNGAPGPTRDRIVLSAGLLDYYLGFCPDPDQALAQACEAIDSGRARARLDAYIAASRDI